MDGHKLMLSKVTLGRSQTDPPPNSLPIVDAAVALDGSSFATLYGDGSICFWQFDEPLIQVLTVCNTFKQRFHVHRRYTILTTYVCHFRAKHHHVSNRYLLRVKVCRNAKKASTLSTFLMTCRREKAQMTSCSGRRWWLELVLKRSPMSF